MVKQGNKATDGAIKNFRNIKRAQPDVQTIRLVAPEQGEVTFPLQRYAWPESCNLAEESEESWKRLLIEIDQSLPRAVTFSWAPVGSGLEYLRYDLVIAADAGFHRKVVVMRGLDATCADVYNLCIGTFYYWRVIARHRDSPRGLGRALATSKVGYFMTNPEPPRWINVPGITNVRDIGGWPLPGGARVRQGLIYRGSEMNSHCNISSEGRNVLIKDLGIRTDLDLRGLGEDRMAVLDKNQVEYVNIPVLAYDSIANPDYTGRYRALFHLLANREKYPIFLHCWGGADRTGTVIFLIQALLGMSAEDLSTEYELTSLSIWGERLRGSEAFQDLLQTLVLFAEEGSSIQKQVERYLTVIGVTVEEMESIREILVEKDRY